MFVLMDLEWFETKSKHIYPTQIAAIRVDERLRTISVFNELIRPHQDIEVPWNHVAFSGASPDSFLCAGYASSVFDRLLKWMGEDDVLCWWADEAPQKLKLLLKLILKHELAQRQCVIRPYFRACIRDGVTTRGNLYELARKRAVLISGEEHCAMNDVITLRKLLSQSGLPISILEGPVPKIPVITAGSSKYLFLCDEDTGLLHVPGGSCIEGLSSLKGMQTIKSCLVKKYKPCPACAGERWKQALKEYNDETVRQRGCAYFFFDHSSVFHRGSCHTIRNTMKQFSSAVYYDTCIKGGRTPCRICKPVPELFADSAEDAKQSGGQWMKRHEREAFARYKQALRDRGAADMENMSDAQRKDMLTLTSSNYAFWAASGYENFHLRNCRRLKGKSNLHGFDSYQKAVRAGYLPCRECRPSKKNNLCISMPIGTREREDETLERIFAACARIHADCSYSEPILSIHTPLADWQINISRRPVAIEHRPFGCNTYHRQHKMFMSVIDAIQYIGKHDKAGSPSLESRLTEIRRRA